ncbi:MAG: hypothetical protein OEU93_06145, partial [Rubrivivax sp.]|nr:hypothetical protein [Rubrivivax sp.]
RVSVGFGLRARNLPFAAPQLLEFRGRREGPVVAATSLSLRAASPPLEHRQPCGYSSRYQVLSLAVLLARLHRNYTKHNGLQCVNTCKPLI